MASNRQDQERDVEDIPLDLSANNSSAATPSNLPLPYTSSYQPNPSTSFANPVPSTSFGNPVPSTSSAHHVSLIRPDAHCFSTADPGSSHSPQIDPIAEQIRRQERERQAERRSNETDEARRVRLDRRNEARRSRRRQDAAENATPAAIFLASNLLDAAFAYDPTFDYSGHRLIQIGPLDRLCRYCGAKCFRGETDGICCAAGKVRLDPIEEPPEPYCTLFSGMYPESKEFLKNIRRYNSCFQMTSFGVSGQVQQGGWQPAFVVQGQIYHRIGSLLPVPEAQPQFLQVYFMGDDECQINHRCNLFEGVRRSLIAAFQELLSQHNRCLRDFKSALDRMPNGESRIVIRGDRTPAGEHRGRYNAPAAEEVALFLVDSEFDRRDIVIQKRDHRLQRIDEMHPLYDALQYPIIFWRGNPTYHGGIPQVVPETGAPKVPFDHVSPMTYYSHQLMIREDNQNFVLKCQNLLNQYVVDMFAKIESERLRYIRYHQRQLRADEYIHLRDAVQADGDGSEVGQRVILPSTFIGGPRHMHEFSQDAMAYVRAYGRPDLFVTFTCNPSWPEINQLLMHGQRSSDRHDVVVRVFNQKLHKFMDTIVKHGLFGPTRCHMYTIEFQKRGLPHAHVLIWLMYRLRADQIDQCISAELPDQQADPILFDIVLSNLVHSPCGAFNYDASCMVDRKCKRKFPKPFSLETQTNTDGYPLYRRRAPEDGGHTAVIKGVEIDNRWVVPYSPVLCRMFNAHINVEYCHSVKSIKYICKYINKGCDMAVVEVGSVNRHDEVSQYQLGRYISTVEAFWRIFHFSMHQRHPPVEKLAVHLENGQRVYFNEENALDLAENPRHTTLTAFFYLNQWDEFARTLFYSDIPTHYTWQANKTWRRRQRGTAVGRLYTVHPNNRECFYLRLLLTKVRGPTSFEDLRTVDGQICSTYREACELRGLLESDSHWQSALEEAAATKIPSQLRSLFAMIVSTCSPSNPAQLWDNFKIHLSEDILFVQRRATNSPTLDYNDSIFNQALLMIEDTCLSMSGKLLSDLGLTSPNRSADLGNSEIIRETSHDMEELLRLVSTNLPGLVVDQRIAFDAIIDAIASDTGGLFFLDAPGGTGKTFLINLILAYVRQRGDIILACASSGIAATLLAGGRTAHSTFKLPLDIARYEEPTCSITRSSAKAGLLKRCKAIIWDECTMTHKKTWRLLIELSEILGETSHFLVESSLCLQVIFDKLCR